MTLSDEEWERRILCSDGNCIGVIGSDGRCKECGKPYAGDQPLPAMDDADTEEPADVVQDAPEATDTDTDVQPGDDAVAVDAGQKVDDDDWQQRTLCIDESCIGVVGPDGRCKECGKPHPDMKTI